MSNDVAVMLTDGGLTAIYDNKDHNVNKSHPRYKDIVAAYKDKQWDVLKSLIDIGTAIVEFGQGKLTVVKGVVKYGDRVLGQALSKRLLAMIEEGFDVGPMVAFLDNLELNPSNRSVTELYQFLEQNKLPLTEDGFFLSYKKVRADYMDFHSQTVLNKPANLMTEEELSSMPLKVGQVTIDVVGGQTILSMERNYVDDNCNRTCSHGLHFCSLPYLSNFGSNTNYHILIVKINPKSVVSIPNDYNFTKGRTSEYTIVGVHTSQVEDAYDTSVVTGTTETACCSHESPVRTVTTTTTKTDYYNVRDSSGKFAKKA